MMTFFFAAVVIAACVGERERERLCVCVCVCVCVYGCVRSPGVLDPSKLSDCRMAAMTVREIYIGWPSFKKRRNIYERKNDCMRG